MVFQPEMRYSGLQFVIQTEVYSVEEESLAGALDLSLMAGNCTPGICTHSASFPLSCQHFTLPLSPSVLHSTVHECSGGDKWLCLSVVESPSIFI